jgi:hypothetical protein
MEQDSFETARILAQLRAIVDAQGPQTPVTSTPRPTSAISSNKGPRRLNTFVPMSSEPLAQGNLIDSVAGSGFSDMLADPANFGPGSANALVVNGKKIHDILRNHPIEKLKRMIAQGYDVENVMFHGTPKRYNTALPTEAAENYTQQIGINDPKGYHHIEPSVLGVDGHGTYLTNTAEEAGGYGRQGHVYPVVTRGTNTTVPDAMTSAPQHTKPRFGGRGHDAALDPGTDKITFPGVMGHDPILDPSKRSRNWQGMSTHQVVKEPQNIRSIFAQFDPNKLESKDLLASFLATLGVGMASRER